MRCTLKILSFKNQPLTASNVVTLDHEGGTIGRSNDNDLVLADPERFVSRHHATISVKNNGFYLTDSSLSGVFINGQEEALQNSSEQIFDGTVLKIGEYQIAVSISDERLDDVDASPFAEQNALDDDYYFATQDFTANSLLTDNGDSFVRHDELIQSDDYANAQPVFESKLRDQPSPLFDNYQAPHVIERPHVAAKANTIEEIPENFSFDDLLTDAVPAIPTQQPAIDDSFTAALHAAIEPIENDTNLSDDALSDNGLFADNLASNPFIDIPVPPTPVASSIRLEKPLKRPPQTLPPDNAFQAFLNGAGIDYSADANQVAEKMHRAGRMFRKLVEGTVGLLRSRAEFKSLFRVNMTVIKATNNNPLKFSVSVDDLLQQLLDNKSGSFLSSEKAIDEGFSDIVHHQLAMQAGIQASLAELLGRFDPKHIEKQFEQGLVLQKKSKCWDKFAETYQANVDDATENFFGEAFTQAYEAQMRALTSERHKKP